MKRIIMFVMAGFVTVLMVGCGENSTGKPDDMKNQPSMEQTDTKPAVTGTETKDNMDKETPATEQVKPAE